MEEVTFPPLMGQLPSDDPVVIKVLIFNREVNRAYMDCGSSCEIIYEHCFLELKPSIRSQRVYSKVPLVGFSGEHSWPLGEIPLDVTIGEGQLARTETLTFAIVRSDSPYNMLIGRTAMQKMGIVVSTIHAAIKFQTTNGIGTVLSNYNKKGTPEAGKKIKENPQEPPKVILSCGDAEERIVVNELHPEQTVVIGKQLPVTFKASLEKLLKDNKDIFAWTYSDMTGVPRSLMIDGKPFGTEHKLNEFKHIEPTKKKASESCA